MNGPVGSRAPPLLAGRRLLDRQLLAVRMPWRSVRHQPASAPAPKPPGSLRTGHTLDAGILRRQPTSHSRPSTGPGRTRQGFKTAFHNAAEELDFL